ncbi:MAG TPA: bifunctional 3-phenylpropionate/cinnamic acid dioxygenase ferredoxin subunit [Chloroflexota bacterium]|jgi:3-phenylpropionate/trans-cinnamate dioxygenase ferredoxin subunit|nr:bifunctional 3-phenylpropionate/cinnamic acid dioxygenase ferredoxin subunit [Chloroflexota bacterium]
MATQPTEMASLVKVAQTSDIPPGTGRLVVIGDRRIAVFNCAGQFYAIDDTCTHAEASLSEGFLENGVIECPLHGARFDVRTGAVLSLPAVRPVATYEVRVEGTDLLVNPEPRPASRRGR